MSSIRKIHKFQPKACGTARNALFQTALGLRPLDLPVLLVITIFEHVLIEVNRIRSKYTAQIIALDATVAWRIASTVKQKQVWLLDAEQMNNFCRLRKRMQPSVTQYRRENWRLALEHLSKFLQGNGAERSFHLGLTHHQIRALDKIACDLAIQFDWVIHDGTEKFRFRVNDQSCV